MKQRIISACVALCVLAVALFWFETYLVNLILSVLAMMGLYELLGAMQLRHIRPLAVLCILFSGMVPLIHINSLYQYLSLIVLCYVFLLFLLLLHYHHELRFDQVGFLFFASLFVPVGISLTVYLRDTKGITVSVFYTLLSLGGAWLSDTGAYFIGRKFGRQKLAPQISPKKTVEGLFGGIAFCVVSYLLIALIFDFVCRQTGIVAEIQYLYLMLLAPVVSLVSVMGDLSASIIKRQCGIKDFGNLMPGHGGMMDRFDSVLFVMPFMYIISLYLPLIQV